MFLGSIQATLSSIESTQAFWNQVPVLYKVKGKGNEHDTVNSLEGKNLQQPKFSLVWIDERKCI